MLKLEEEIENANRAVILKIINNIKEKFEEVKFNVKEDIDEHSAQEIAEACAEIEEYAKELRLLLKTYIVE